MSYINSQDEIDRIKGLVECIILATKATNYTGAHNCLDDLCLTIIDRLEKLSAEFKNLYEK